MTRYTPILRFMRGERIGLQHVSAAGRNGVTPLMVLAPKQYVGKKATQKTPALPAPAVIANEIRNTWGTAPFYLDASALAAPAGGHHPMTDIGAACRAIGLNMIPATPLNVTPAYRQSILVVTATDNRGAAIRLDLNEFSSTAQWMHHWPIAVNLTDLVVDIGDNAPIVANLGAAIINVFQALAAAGHWRSVTIAGTSMPENFTGLAAGKHLIPRAEFSLWQQLNGAQLGYQIDYGDYATAPIAPPPSGIAWGFPINVRYTLANYFLICRGVATTGFGGVDMAPQLTAHAGMITQHAGRQPLQHCWADGVIDAIAANQAGPQGLEHWVQLGVNRHVELIRSLLP